MAEDNTSAETPEAANNNRLPTNRYTQIIEKLFFNHYQEGSSDVLFDRSEMAAIASRLGINLPKNIGDVVYSMRYRTPLPQSVIEKAPAGKEWIILPAGRSRYRFHATDIATVMPRPGMVEIKITRRNSRNHH